MDNMPLISPPIKRMRGVCFVCTGLIVTLRTIKVTKTIVNEQTVTTIEEIDSPLFCEECGMQYHNQPEEFIVKFNELDYTEAQTIDLLDLGFLQTSGERPC